MSVKSYMITNANSLSIVWVCRHFNFLSLTNKKLEMSEYGLLATVWYAYVS